MNYGQLKNQVMKKLGLDPELDESLVEEWIHTAYMEAVQETGAFQQTASAALTAGQSSYLVPGNVQWIKQLQIGYQDGSFSLPLQYVPLETILSYKRGTLATGQMVDQPLYATVGSKQIELWPEPGDGQTLHFWFTYLPVPMDDDSDVPEIAEPYDRVIEYGALVEGARFKKDPLLADYEMAHADWMRRYQRWLNRRRTGTSEVIRTSEGRSFQLVFPDRSTDLFEL